MLTKSPGAQRLTKAEGIARRVRNQRAAEKIFGRAELEIEALFDELLEAFLKPGQKITATRREDTRPAIAAAVKIETNHLAGFNSL